MLLATAPSVRVRRGAVSRRRSLRYLLKLLTQAIVGGTKGGRDGADLHRHDEGDRAVVQVGVVAKVDGHSLSLRQGRDPSAEGLLALRVAVLRWLLYLSWERQPRGPALLLVSFVDDRPPDPRLQRSLASVLVP